MKHTTIAAGVALLLASGTFAQGDPETIERIIAEGRDNSQVWDTLTYVSEEIGPRLTGSSRLERACVWARDTFTDMGLKSWLFRWGDIPVRFDRGPSTCRMVEPAEFDFEFTTRSWSAGTDGPVRGRVVKQPETLEELEAMRDELAGAWVLANAPPRGRRRGVVPEGEAPNMREEIEAALTDIDILGKLVASRGEIVNTGGMSGWREMSYDDLPTDVTIRLRRSDYDAINSRLADGEDVVVEANLTHHFVEGPIPVFNVIAELRGTELPDEVIIVSAHLDSWDGPGSMGTQDNGTGSSVTIETARILTAAGVRPRRTIRFILWSGEEQGLLGSRRYVESLSEEELAGISAVFVDDGGTNYQGGLVCVEAMADMLAAATAPVNEAFPDLPVEITIRERMPRGGGSDHASFNRRGVPGFFWTEDGVGGREGKDYRFVWHTQNDTLRYAVPEYLTQSATCSAVTAYNLAMAETMLPRYVPSGDGGDAEGEGPRRRRGAGDAVSGATPDAPFNVVEGPVSGRWNAVVTDSEYAGAEFTLTFEMADDGRVRGQIESQIGQGAMSKVAWDAEASTVTFQFDSEMIGLLSYTGKVEGDKMTGTLGTEGGDGVPFEATRGEAAKAEEAKATDGDGDGG